MDSFELYKDMRERTNGELYIGIVGPVRTGKSTFIKQFMEQMILPEIEDGYERQRIIDELPQSGNGKMITTVEPKFIPKEAVEIEIAPELKIKVRLMDCVGYVVPEAVGYLEEGEERLLHTPWYENPIPFEQAAEIGTRQVICEHATVGIVVTTDGSIGELSRIQYKDAEQKTIEEMKKTGKPFVVLVNTANPESKETKKLVAELQEEYKVRGMALNFHRLEKEDFLHILENLLYEFPLQEICFHGDCMVELLGEKHPVKQKLLCVGQELLNRIQTLGDAQNCPQIEVKEQGIEKLSLQNISLGTGVVHYSIEMTEDFCYTMLGELTGVAFENEYSLYNTLTHFGEMWKEYSKIKEAMLQVEQTGYGIVTPEKKEIILKEPELIQTGNNYGVKLIAQAPCIHMIRAEVITEISPIAGTKEQAEDLISYIGTTKQGEDEENATKILDTNLFGKTIHQIVEEGIQGKLSGLSPETRDKLQDTVGKITNESSGSVVCFVI